MTQIAIHTAERGNAQVKYDPTSKRSYTLGPKFLAMIEAERARQHKHDERKDAGKTEYVAGDLTALQLTSLEAFTRPDMTARQISEAIGRSRQYAQSSLSALEVKGYVNSRWDGGSKLWSRTDRQPYP